MVVHYGFNGEVVRPDFNYNVITPAFQREYGSLVSCTLDYSGNAVSGGFAGDNMLSGTTWASATTTMTFSATAMSSTSGQVIIGASNGTSATYTMFSGTEAVQASALQFQHGGASATAAANFVALVNGEYGLGSGTYNLVQATDDGSGKVTLTQYGAGVSGNANVSANDGFIGGTLVNASAFAGGTDNNDERWHIWGANILPPSGANFGPFFNAVAIGYTADNLVGGAFTSLLSVQGVAHTTYGAAAGGVTLQIPISMPVGKKLFCKGINGTGAADKAIVLIHALKTSGYHGNYNQD
jgi:hypothetical protein